MYILLNFIYLFVKPFYYKKEIIGVIGITGLPKEISMLTNIVKSMIEVMYEQEILKQSEYIHDFLINKDDDDG